MLGLSSCRGVVFVVVLTSRKAPQAVAKSADFNLFLVDLGTHWFDSAPLLLVGLLEATVANWQMRIMDFSDADRGSSSSF